MWGGGVLSLVRQGLLLRRRPRRRRTTARVVDETSALGEAAVDGAVDVAAARGGAPAAHAAMPGAELARAVLAMAWGAVRLDGGGRGRGAEEAWAAASGWRPARAADEIGHLMVRESLRYVIYA